jgi:molybdenum cofactor guanylyltransferase
VGLTGIILAGGRSARFGSDKAWAQLRGRALLDWVSAAVAEVCDEIIVVKALGQELPATGARLATVEDFVEGTGPVAGMVAGLRAVSTEYAFAVSCDAPLLQPAVIRLLVERAAGRDGALPEADGAAQPLVAVYRVATVLPALEAAFAAGERRLLRALLPLDLARPLEHELRLVDKSLRSFVNANDPAVLEGLEELLGARPG